MRKKLLASIALTSMLVAGAAGAAEAIKFPVNKNTLPQTIKKSDWKGCYLGRRVPVIPQDFYDVMVVTADGSKPTLSKIKETLDLATTNAGWEVQQPVEDGKAGRFIAFKNIDNKKHTATVQVYYNTEKFSIIYITSTNLAEATCGGRIFLHKNYNVWVNQLKTAISRSLAIM